MSNNGQTLTESELPWHPAWLPTSFPHGESGDAQCVWCEALEDYVRDNLAFLASDDAECKAGARHLFELFQQYPQLRQSLGITICRMDVNILLEEILENGEHRDLAIACIFDSRQSRALLSNKQLDEILECLERNLYRVG